MVISFGKVIGVMIIATALTVFKAISVKDFTEIYLQNIHTLIAPEIVIRNITFPCLTFQLHSIGNENCVRYTERCK